MGKRNAGESENHYESPQKRQKVDSFSASFAETPNGSPALNLSFTLTREFVEGTILTDLALKDWRIGKPIGKGSFGEIFLASDDIFKPVTSENARYVVKIEPHSNGPLFVEIHALLNTAKRTESNVIPPGMPEYIASGSHYFKNERYRFLILKRYQRDLHSLIKNKRMDPKSIPVIACQILDVLEHLHDKGYVHSDIKAENLMIGKVPVSATTSVISTKLSESSPKGAKKNNAVSNGYSGLSSTPTVMTKKSTVEFCGSNPVRSCRAFGGADSETYQDMVKSHYLRPLKNIVYRDDSDEEDLKNGKKKRKRKKDGDCSKSFFYKITARNVDENYKQIKVQVSRNGAAFDMETPKVSVNGREKKAAVEPREDRIHLIDFGLASKFLDSTGQHRPFCMDQRRAHDGTLEFTSRDAHMGAHARRSDLECLGYNLVFWSRGFLPWKDEKLLNQPEQVHRMKEYFMTDVREMLKMIYGEDCPKYLGEFLHYVGGLTYDERPDYDYPRSLFHQELRRLGHNPKSRLVLNVSDIAKLSQPLTAQDEAEITNKINHVKSLMKMGVLPYRESTLHSKTTSPKNLRSKRDSTRTPANGKINGAKDDLVVTNGKDTKEKKFSWSDILSTDPDQIARERAEKEFERADQMEEVVIKYSGNPTYAIRDLENKRVHGTAGGGLDYTESEDYIRGYTKPMMDILKKRQSQLMRDLSQSCYSNGVKEPPDDKQGSRNSDNDDDNDEEEEDVDENSSENDQYVAERDANGLEEADSGNDDVVSEEREEDDQIHKKGKRTQGKQQESRKPGRKRKHVVRKNESDSDFINDAEEGDDLSDSIEAIGKNRKVRRGHLQSESSDQHDSDFNDQESSEYESRERRIKRPRGRPRLNRDDLKPDQNRPYSKANGGKETNVPVIAKHNNNNNKPYYGDVDDSSHDVPTQQHMYRLMKRRKSGLRERIRQTDRSIKYHDDLQLKRSKKSPRKRYSDDEDYCQMDETSCSSAHSIASVASSVTASSDNSNFSEYLTAADSKRKSTRKRAIRSYSNSSRSALSSNSRSSPVRNVANGVTSNGSSNRAMAIGDDDEFYDDDDTRDMDYSPTKAKRGRKPHGPRKTVTFKKKNGECKGSFSLV
ncbi:uncharacterized protein LOC129765247 isoform X2 [Toxorhynchites rutilus septentrionalis]|uniref:uncharacterized protein LOC129765247 isoform X2 n=1 Tax=Toxorhynchites rutilus septentrionalis TaxID=329112 RepID=UPI002478B5C7|nr:uncharacterized protein LOC129765247 isoform X2 [Toxorhynchites rutilus septentrionalis]XP_055621324.1 uncharacterized protein LOC129765247 isoform X2 [Toxorhynchites rutilus septentrionalis]XP_055621325.1 uncharacterized protein LOC129765247 isoform X2 [Toxorhynchites rutilus septentrionalis]